MNRTTITIMISKEITRLKQRFLIKNKLSKTQNQPHAISDPFFMKLPNHLQRSYVVVAFKGECNAEIVSSHTGRCRAIESNYLNQLTRMGWLTKRRISKTVHFKTIAENL